MVETFGVNLRTASRYLAEIRKYLVEREEQDHVHRELYYDRARKVYRIRELEEEMIRPSELYAIGKILLASRAFHKKELESLLRRLLQSAVLGTDKKKWNDIYEANFSTTWTRPMKSRMWRTCGPRQER